MGRLAFRAGDNATAVTLAERALIAVPEDRQPCARRPATVPAAACNTLGVALARRTGRLEAVRHIEHSVAQAEAHDLLRALRRGFQPRRVPPARSTRGSARHLDLPRLDREEGR